MELPSVQHCDTSTRNSWPWWSIGAMQQRGSKTTVMPCRAVGLKDFLKVKGVEYQWNDWWQPEIQRENQLINESINKKIIKEYQNSELANERFMAFCYIKEPLEKISANSVFFRVLKWFRTDSRCQGWCYVQDTLSKKHSIQFVKLIKFVTMKKRGIPRFFWKKPRLFLGTCDFIGSRFYCSTGKRNYGCLEKHEIIMP